MSTNPDRLFELLPAIYRKRDAEQGQPLRALLQVMAEQVDVVEKDVARLYENWFIETCEDWVVPYIGDLVGYEAVHAAGQPSDLRTAQGRTHNRILTPRSEVANTIRNRRRKGTLYLLELLARDVADWPGRAVEFFKLVGFTQNLNHLKPKRGGTVDLRHGDAFDRIDGPFDELAHTIEVRRPNSALTRGRYNIPSVGLFVWRLRAYSVTRTFAYHWDHLLPPHCFTFSVLANDVPLFNRAEPDPEITRIEDELHLPVPIRRKALEGETIELADTGKFRIASEKYYGEGKSLAIYVEGWPEDDAPKHLLPREQVLPANLAEWKLPGDKHPKGYVAVDPELGRLMFPSKHAPPKMWLSYSYGFVSEMGGGEYRRELLEPSAHPLSLSIFRSYDLKPPDENFKPPHAFLARLKSATPSPVALYLTQQLAEATRELLDKHDLAKPPSATLLEALADDLTALIQGGSFYLVEDPAGRKIFEDVPTTAAIQTILMHEKDLKEFGQSLSREEIIRLNRLLLESEFANELAPSYAVYYVAQEKPEGIPAERFFPTLMSTKDTVGAVETWAKEAPCYGVIEILDSSVYTEQPVVALKPGQTLQIRAANGRRPAIRMLDINFSGPDAFVVKGAKDSRIILDGLLIFGRGVHVENEMAEAHLRHCTLVPGWSLNDKSEPINMRGVSLSLIDTQARVYITHSILGAIQVEQDEVKTEPLPLFIEDSILDATGLTRDALSAGSCEFAHAALTLKRCTVLGHVHAHEITLAENSLFMGLVTVARRQSGCLRFCYVTTRWPMDTEVDRKCSRTPRRFNCQPDLAERALLEKRTGAALSESDKEQALSGERMRVRPQFNSSRYGAPQYCQLAHSCAPEIKRGADDESEMGAYHDLFQPQREANLRVRLEEYTPAGMDAGIFFAN